MSWNTIPADRRNQLAEILTDRQLTVLRHRTNGHTWRTIAHALNIHEATCRAHHQAALDRIQRHLEQEDAA